MVAFQLMGFDSFDVEMNDVMVYYIGCMDGLKFELVVNSETLRKPNKVKLNMASRVLILLEEIEPECRIVRGGRGLGVYWCLDGAGVV